jgi:hypothetical protein
MTWKARLAAIGMSILEALGMAAGKRLAGKLTGDDSPATVPSAAPAPRTSKPRKPAKAATAAARSRR